LIDIRVIANILRWEIVALMRMRHVIVIIKIHLIIRHVIHLGHVIVIGLHIHGAFGLEIIHTINSLGWNFVLAFILAFLFVQKSI
jgi:hypothetical protein